MMDGEKVDSNQSAISPTAQRVSNRPDEEHKEGASFTKTRVRIDSRSAARTKFTASLGMVCQPWFSLTLYRRL
jgi:hypothetical protein